MTPSTDTQSGPEKHVLGKMWVRIQICCQNGNTDPTTGSQWGTGSAGPTIAVHLWRIALVLAVMEYQWKETQ